MWSEARWWQEWAKALSKAVADEVERNGQPPHEWQVFGRATKAHPNREDRAFWELEGVHFAKSYAQWRLDNPEWRLWITPDGRPANELDFVADFGGYGVRCIIDRVFQYTPHGDEEPELAVVDLKSGRNMPEDTLQLQFYSAGIDLRYGVRPRFGGYFDARKGKLVALEPLDDLSTMDLVELVSDYMEQSQAGVHLPNPGRQCSFCEVAAHCKWASTLATPIKARLQ